MPDSSTEVTAGSNTKIFSKSSRLTKLLHIVSQLDKYLKGHVKLMQRVKIAH